jgi:hypothetical protein
MRATVARSLSLVATLGVLFVWVAICATISACDQEPQPTKPQLSESRPSTPLADSTTAEPPEVHLPSDVPSPAEWPKEPTSFQGVPFGVSRQTADAKFKFLQCYPHNVDETECSGDVIPIGPVNAVPQFTFNSRNQFVAIRLSQYTHEFDYLKDIFIERYGKPTTTRSGVSKTGVPAPNELLIWQGQAINVTLLRHSGDMKWSCAEIVNRAWQDHKLRTPREQDDMRWTCVELFDHSWAEVMAEDAKKADKEAKKKAASTF